MDGGPDPLKYYQVEKLCSRKTFHSTQRIAYDTPLRHAQHRSLSVTSCNAQLYLPCLLVCKNTDNCSELLQFADTGKGMLTRQELGNNAQSCGIIADPIRLF